MIVSRRGLLGSGLLGLGALAAGCAADPAPAVVGTPSAALGPAAPDAAAADRFAAIEAGFGGRLGVYAVDTATGATTGYRAGERFLMCSTSKVPTVAAVLRARVPLDEVVRYGPERLVTYSPVTSTRSAMSVRELCAAALTVSDNTAENLLLDRIGGPAAVEAFARSIGDGISSFDRPEPLLNSRGGPDGTWDTSTPAQLVTTLRACALGDALDPAGRAQLTDWLVANTTGDARIRAGLPAGWRTGDKTGSGDRKEVNDIAITWPPGRPPVVLGVLTAPADPTTTANVPAVPATATAAISALRVPF